MVLRFYTFNSSTQLVYHLQIPRDSKQTSSTAITVCMVMLILVFMMMLSIVQRESYHRGRTRAGILHTSYISRFTHLMTMT